MARTPDEIKKGLGEAVAEASWVVDDGDMHDLRDALDNARARMADALALIHQLQAENAEKDERIRQIEAERDAAVESMRSDPHCCYHCANMTKRGICQSEPRADGHCFEWRGVQKEE